MKILQPYRTDDELEDPDAKHYVQQFIPLQFAKHTKAHSSEYNHTNERMGKIIGQSHFADT